MGAAAALLIGGGGLLQAGGAHYGMRAQQESIKYNIRLQQRQAQKQDEAIQREGARALAANRVAVAKSGVRLEGSPLEVMAANASEIAEARREAAFAAQSEINLLRGRREALGPATGLSIASTLLGTGGQAAVAMA